MKIFVLEDCPKRIEWFKTTFASDEIDIFSCDEKSYIESFCKVMNHLEEKTYDIIFLDRDLSNPKLNGEDIAWHMKETK